MEPASGHQSAETDYHLQSSHSVNFTLSFVLSSESKMTMESKQKQAPEWFSSPLLFSLACKQDETFQKKWGNSCVVNSNRAKYDEKMVTDLENLRDFRFPFSSLAALTEEDDQDTMVVLATNSSRPENTSTPQSPTSPTERKHRPPALSCVQSQTS